MATGSHSFPWLPHELRDTAFYWSGQEGSISKRVMEEVDRHVLLSGPLLLRTRGTLARERRAQLQALIAGCTKAQLYDDSPHSPRKQHRAPGGNRCSLG